MALCGLAQLEVFLNDLNIVSYRTLGKTNTMIYSLIFQLCVELGVILITVLARTGQTNASKFFVHRSFQQLKKEMWFYHKNYRTAFGEPPILFVQWKNSAALPSNESNSKRTFSCLRKKHS